MKSLRPTHLRIAIFIERRYPLFGFMLLDPRPPGLFSSGLSVRPRRLSFQNAASLSEILDLLFHPLHGFVPDGALVSFRSRYRRRIRPAVIRSGQLATFADTGLPCYLDRIVGPRLSPPNYYSSARHLLGPCMIRIESSTICL